MIFTAKRTVFLFAFISILSAVLIFRIAYISDTLSSDTGAQNSARVMSVGNSRGMIYDRNMLPLVNCVSHKMLFINPTEDALTYLSSQLSSADIEQVMADSADGKPFLFLCDGYTGSHRDITEIITFDRYSSDDLAVHLTGYTDAEGNGVSGIEKAFDGLLKQYSGSLSVRYEASASGTLLGGYGVETTGDNYASQGGIVLTIDRGIQRICESTMERAGMEKGAVVVLDADTSEILALASRPVFDRTELKNSLDDEAQPFVNRALSAYAVGSVFKPVVAAAALEKGFDENTCFECTGSVNVSGVVFNCHERSGHGVLNMTEAMAVSCNCYFIKLGQAAGSEKILNVASSLGFGNEVVLSDGFSSASGNLPDDEDIDSLPSLANLSFGQGALLATPLQIGAVYCAIANGGYYREPYVLKQMVDENGEVYAEYRNENENKVLTDSVCLTLQKMLLQTVSVGSGSAAKPMCGDAAGKTATAETGQVADGEKKVHTWFAGYYPANEPEYVIVIFREDGSYSSTDCAPVFRDIADGIIGMKD